MNKTVLITGSTDGIGLATAKSYLSLGHKVLIHGRSSKKLDSVRTKLITFAKSVDFIETYQADLSKLSDVKQLADDIKAKHSALDILINNAGAFIVPDKVSSEGLDTRFAVNTLAPYLLTQLLLPIIPQDGRIVNLSSAAQESLSPEELTKPSTLPDGSVYAKSKLALTMWSIEMANTLGNKAQVVVAVNPKSFLNSNMVKQAYGREGKDIQLGADILVEAGLSDSFKSATGKYYDNDIEQFSNPHPDALNAKKRSKLKEVLQQLTEKYNL